MSDKRNIGQMTQVPEAKSCTRCNHKREPSDKPYKRLSLDGETIAYLCSVCEGELRELYA